MTSQDLRKYDSVQKWLEGLKPDYQRKSLEYFQKFLEYVKLNPDEMLQQRREDLRSQDMEQQRRFERLAKTYYEGIRTEFQKQGKSESHAWNYLKSVMSFFSRNYMPLKYKKKELKLPKRKLKRTGIVIADLKEAYTLLDVRERAIFTTLLQTGLSPIDLCNLNIEQIVNELDNPPIYIEGYRTKTEVGYQTCIGEDSAIAIKKYLILRGNPTTGALFLARTGERLTPRFLRESLEPQVRKVIPKFQIKDLRDVYHDALERADIPQNVRDRLFGHEILTSTRAYEFTPTTIKEAYMKAYPFLTVNGYTRQTARNLSVNKITLRLGVIIASEKPREELAKFIDELREEMNMPKISEEDRIGFTTAGFKEIKSLQSLWLETASRYLEAV